MKCSETIETGSAMRLRFSERMTFNDHVEMKRISRYVGSNRVARVNIDLSALSFIDSAGLGMLLILGETLRESGGTMVLESPQGQVARVFAATKFLQWFSPKAPAS
ncbi:MAG: STAS domain-containing protein [Rhodospirillaceae bacterium]